jgi:hypothetical protein
VNPQILGVIHIAASLPLREEWWGEFKSENENIYNYAYAYGKYGHLRSVLTHILGFVGFCVIFYEICHRLAFESFLHLLDIICMAGGLFYTLNGGAIIYQRKENKGRMHTYTSQSTVFSSSQAMAQRKETPKIIYPKSALFSECKCRLCGSIIDK